MKSIFHAFCVLAACAAIVAFGACKTKPSLAPAEKSRLGELWSLYVKDDSAWPQKRDAALQAPLDREFLIQNLVREVVRGVDEAKNADLAKSSRAHRASEEIVRIGEPAVPLLIALFPAKDPAVADAAARVLAKVGEPALPELNRAMGSEDARLRRWSVIAFASMEPPREETRVIAVLADAEWSVRGAAVQALVRYPSLVAEAATVKALRDVDAFVRRQAAEALATRGAAEQVPELIAYLRASQQRGAREEIDTAKTALFALTRKNFGAETKAWQEWWEKSKKKP